ALRGGGAGVHRRGRAGLPLDRRARARDRAWRVRPVPPGPFRRCVRCARAAGAGDGQDGVRGRPGRAGPARPSRRGVPRLIGDEGLSYAAAGVDIEAYERMLERVRPLIAAAQGPEVVAGVGPFAGTYE